MPRKAPVIAFLAGAATACCLFAVGNKLAAKAFAKAVPTEFVAAIRTELADALSAPSDAEFVKRYAAHLDSRTGVYPSLIFGERVVVGGGWMLAADREAGKGALRLIDGKDRTARTFRGNFLAVLVDGKESTAVPQTPAQLEKTIVIAGYGGHVLIIDLGSAPSAPVKAVHVKASDLPRD